MSRLQETLHKDIRHNPWLRRIVTLGGDPGLGYLQEARQQERISREEAEKSGLGKRYWNDVDSRPHVDILSRNPGYSNVETFLRDRQKGRPEREIHQAFLKTEIGQHFQKIADGLTSNPGLAQRTESLFQAVLELRQLRQERGEQGLQVPDATVIQGWALQLIGRKDPEEYAKIAKLAFAEWVTRLSDNPIPHIVQANEWIAQKVADHLAQQGKTAGIHAVDLGAGTGATMLALAEGMITKGISFESIKGVDITPLLVDKATQLFSQSPDAQKLSIEVGNARKWLESQPDNSLDVVSMVYAIHHLPFDQQKELESIIYKKLKPGGIFGLADPTGRSRFNLDYLDITEPEATAACFRPLLSQVVHELENRGFAVDYRQPPVNGKTVASTQQGDTLDQGTLGYAIVAVKPNNGLKMRRFN